MKNKKKIMILTLIVSIIVLIFSLTYVFLINKNTDKTLLMKSFEEISTIIENNLPNSTINNFNIKGELNSNYFNKINLELKRNNNNFEIIVNNTILSHQNNETYIYNSDLGSLGFLKRKDLINSGFIKKQNYKENYKIIKNSILKAIESKLKSSNFKKYKEKDLDRYIIKIDSEDMTSIFKELSQDKKFTEVYKNLTGKEFTYRNNKASKIKDFEYILYSKSNTFKKVVINKNTSISFNNDYKLINHKTKNINLELNIKNNTIFEHINLKYNNIIFDMILKENKDNQYIYDIKYNYLTNSYILKLEYVKDKSIVLTGNGINLKINIDMNKNVDLTKVNSKVREASNEELEEILIKLLQTILKGN